MTSRTSVTSRVSTDSSSLPYKYSTSKNTSSVASSSFSSSHHAAASSSMNLTSSNNMTPAIYLSRLMDVSQMDIQSSLDQMKSLLLPMKMNSVYKMAYYRKQTKSHWARDDPAFVFLILVALTVSSLAYTIAFRSDSILRQFITFTLQSILINYGLMGIIIAATARTICDTYLNASLVNTTENAGNPLQNKYHAQQSVEFMYAFDVHSNAFVFWFVVIYGIQFFLLPVVLGKGFVGFLISNLLYSVGFFGYFYITHLGYRGEFLFYLVALLGILRRSCIFLSHITFLFS